MSRKIVIAATPTSPLLPQLIHALQHEANLDITVLTRQTSISVTNSRSHSHAHNGETNGHHHESKVTHTQTDFSASELEKCLKSVDTLICVLTGSDLHLSAPLIDAAVAAGVKLFIPSEYGLDTSNSRIRDLLPPYRTRFEIQKKLRASGSGMHWKAIYCGIGLEEGMKTDGVMGVDALWGSVVVFPGGENMSVAISTVGDVAGAIFEVVLEGDGRKVEGNEVWTCGFKCTLDEIVEAVEKEVDRDVDRYEGDLGGAEKEAKERMKMGYFDGGVALMGRVAVWDGGVDAWSGWKGEKGKERGVWEEEVRRVVRQVRSGEVGGDGYGC